MARLSGLARELVFSRGELIFQEGETADGFYIVGKGKIKVFKLSFDGKEQILHIYGPGKTFGEVPVFQGTQFPAAAMALESSTILFIPRKAFVDLITDSPTLAMGMLAELSRRLRGFTVQIENLSLKEVPARMAGYLLTLAREAEALTGRPPDRVTLPISKAQLANLIGTTPETISRILKKMAGTGLIRVETKDIILEDPQGLAEVAEAGKL
jgi:CRP/FNR family transcriptional regulator